MGGKCGLNVVFGAKNRACTKCVLPLKQVTCSLP